MKKQVIFITGLGGTGKSSIVEYFQNNPISGFIFYDFDTGKQQAPDYKKHATDHLKWRIQQTEYWLDFASQEYEKSKNIAVICGLSLWPSKLRELNSAKNFLSENIHFAYLSCLPEIRKERLISRGNPDHWKGHQAWYDDFFAEMKKEGAKEFDTSQKSIKETAQELKLCLSNLA